MICKTCGAKIPDGSKVCEHCGTEIMQGGSVKNTNNAAKENEKKQASNIFDNNEKKRRDQLQKMMDDKKQQLSEIERRRNEKRQRQRRNKIILIAAICALAVSAVGLGVYYVAGNINSKKPNIAVSPSPLPSVTTAALISPSPAASPIATISMDTSAAQNSDAASAGSSGSGTQSWSATGSGGSQGSSRPSSGSASNGTSSANTSSAAASQSGAGNKKPSSGGQGGTTSNMPVSNSGVSNSKISSQLVKGSEVIHNTGTGRYLMTFVNGSTRYYANVSAGSTTDQVKNKYYTVTAVPTGETYNGNTVYEITSMTKYEGDYILPNSGTRLLTNDDIKGLSKYQLALARNEIYARHGRKFQTEEYSNYFKGKSWYSIKENYNYSDDDSNLNEIERKNVQFILAAERR